MGRDVELGRRIDTAIGVLESAKNDHVLTVETLRSVMDDVVNLLRHISETQRSDYPTIPEGSFHAKDDLYFKKEGALNQGPGVKIIVKDIAFWGTGVKVFNIDEGTWASIVAHVSAFGESHESWQKALHFHNGKV